MKMISNCRLPRVAIVLLTVAWALVTSAAAPIWNWPAPASEAVFEDYKLTVGGVEVPVYACRVSAVPFNQVWPGYQRPLDQTETAGFAYWDMRGPVNLEIRCQRAPGSVLVRPQSLGIKAVIAGDRIRFTLQRPRPIVVEMDGPHHALQLFASSPEQDVPKPDSPGVRYFGPGVHRPGKIELQNNQTVYIAGGAVVYGCISGKGVSKVRICGRGILDASQFERDQGGGVVKLQDCSDIFIEGIVMRDPDVWCCSLFGCRRVTIQNIKLIGLWRYNSDGIDICNSENVTVRDCFVRSYDDSLVVKGLKWGGSDSYHERSARNIRFTGCVLWNDWGRAAEIGAETSAPEISGIVFEDCDVIHNTHIALDIQHGDRAWVRDIRFEDIRVEVDQNNSRPRIQEKPGETYSPGAPDYLPELLVIVIRKNPYSQDDQRGTVRNVVFKNISVTGPRMLGSWLRGLDAEHTVSGVSIENLRFNGERVKTTQDAHLRLDDHVEDVLFRESAAVDPALRSLRVELPGQEHNAIKMSWPGIGCWFMTAPDFQAEGYKRFIDLHERHSGYGLLTTSIRHHVEVTQPEVHEQIKKAAEYAHAHGMEVVMDLDVRLARQAFMEKHPGEMQEIVRLREIPLRPDGQASLLIDAIKLEDHYTPTSLGVRPYESLSSRLLRAYSYVVGPQGIEPATIQDISVRCHAVQDQDKALKVTIPCTAEDRGRTACLLAAFTLFTPDVFAPHLTGFERSILKQYADVRLAGACKDEWGFPGRFSPRLDDQYFSPAMAGEYARRRPGRDLVRDLLLMVKPHQGREAERAAAINYFMEMYWQRNAEVENAYYQSIKDVFGPQAMSATHPTWWPNPATREEVFKNGLDWWACRRDLAQTDEATPFCVRTALAKKWYSPLWVNMYYDRTLGTYREDLWRHALGGGRMNFHPIYPFPADASPDHRIVSLLGDKLLAADCRIRLLNFISPAPIDCPVAVVFGHPAVLNWAGSGLADTGLAITDRLWAEGFYADLIPSSEIATGALSVGQDRRIQYGPQRYDAVVFYQPQYERASVAEFFRRAAAAKTALFRVGEWTRDFEGRPFNGPRALPAAMQVMTDADVCARAVIAHLQAAGTARQTPCTKRGTAGFAGSMMPKPSGQCRLLDGTVILASGEKDVMGDPIKRTIVVTGHDVTFDAVGVAAVRLDTSGQVIAMAAAGLKTFVGSELRIELPERADVALWRNHQNQWQGVLQGHSGPVPDGLNRITTNWARLRLPVPLGKEPQE